MGKALLGSAERLGKRVRPCDSCPPWLDGEAGDFTRRPAVRPRCHCDEPSAPALVLPRGQASSFMSGAAASSQASQVEVWSSQTRFEMADIVHCSHCPEGQCQKCAQRIVSDVPVATYSAFCTAFAR